MNRISEIIDEFRRQTEVRDWDCFRNQENRELVNIFIDCIAKASKEEYKRGVLGGLLIAQQLCNNQIQSLIDEAEGGQK